MEIFTHKKLGSASIASASNTTVYTVPDATKSIIKIIHICNCTNADATIELWHIANGGSAADSNKILNGFIIPANEFMQIFTDQGMANVGDFIQAKGSVNNALTVSLFGAEIT